MNGDPGGFIKFSIIAVLVGLIVFYAVQTRARLIFPDYDKINKIDEFYFAGDFRSAMLLAMRSASSSVSTLAM